MSKKDEAKHRARYTVEFKLEAVWPFGRLAGQGRAGGVGDGEGAEHPQADAEQLGLIGQNG